MCYRMCFAPGTQIRRFVLTRMYHDSVVEGVVLTFPLPSEAGTARDMFFTVRAVVYGSAAKVVGPDRKSVV